jgi:Mg-chelatase subunit ChlD
MHLPIHIIFCIDTSASMSGGKLEYARAGIKESIKKLSDGDLFSVVSFSNNASVTVPPTSGDQWRSVTGDIDSLTSGGGTHIVNGLEQSRKVLEQMFSQLSNQHSVDHEKDAIQWIALVTDGRPGGLEDPSQLLDVPVPSSSRTKIDKHGAVAEALSNQGLTVHTAGVGDDYGKDIVEVLSARSQGESSHCSTGEDIESFFGNHIRNAQKVVATDPTLELTPKNEVTIEDIFLSVPQSKEVDVQKEEESRIVDVPDLNQEELPMFAFKLSLPPHDPDPYVTLATATLAVGSESVSEDLGGEYTEPEKVKDSLLLGRNEDIHEEYIGTKTSVIARKSPQKAQEEIEQYEQEHDGSTALTRQLKDQYETIESGDTDSTRTAEDEASRAIARKKREDT